MENLVLGWIGKAQSLKNIPNHTAPHRTCDRKNKVPNIVMVLAKPHHKVQC